MNLIEIIKNSFSLLAANKVRSFLTMLGIIIGVMAVIIVMSVGAGAQSLILNQVKSVGSNLVAVLPGAAEDDGPPASAMGIIVTTLTYDDGFALAKDVDNIDSLTMYVTGSDVVTYGSTSINATYSGTTASYLDVEDTEVMAGRFFGEEEERGIARVVVLGYGIKDELFGDDDAVGKRIRMGKTTMTVIGVMKKRGVSGFQNQDDQMFVPISTAQKLLLGIDHINFLRAKVDEPENVERVMNDIRMILRDRHDIEPGQQDDFSVRSMAQGLAALSSITNALKFFLVAISAIALVVGGFGIMNIMLANVQERTREIGLRKAIGATSGDIILQFLVESVVITFLGGIIGILLGMLVSVVVAKVAQSMGYDWDLVITVGSILLGAGVSVGIGLLFGILPAKRASKLNAIEALRYE